MGSDPTYALAEGFRRSRRLGLSAALAALLATVPSTGAAVAAAAPTDEHAPAAVHAAAPTDEHAPAAVHAAAVPEHRTAAAGDQPATLETAACPQGVNRLTRHSGFADVPDDHFAADDIACLARLEVMKGSTATLFAPDATTTRAQIAALLARLWRAAGQSCPAAAPRPFTDLPAGHFAAGDVACLARLGVVKGSTATVFAPDATTTRAEIAALLARLWRAAGQSCPAAAPRPFTDLPAGHFAAGDVACLAGAGVVKGATATLFAPDATATRAQTAALVARVWRTGLHSSRRPDSTSGAGGAGGSAGAGGSGGPQRGSSPPAGVPGAPELTGFRQGKGSITVQWARPDDEGQSSLTGFNVQYGVGAAPCSAGQIAWQDWTHSSIAAVATVTGLTNGLSYCFRVRAVNSQGAGAWSDDPSAAVMVVGTPGPPQSPTLAAGDAQVTVTWQEPSDNGGLAIQAYNVQYDEDPPGFYLGPASWNPNGHSNHWIFTTTATIDEDEYGDPLTNGTKYRVRVRAWNECGPGEWSAWSTATPTAP